MLAIIRLSLYSPCPSSLKCHPKHPRDRDISGGLLCCQGALLLVNCIEFVFGNQAWQCALKVGGLGDYLVSSMKGLRVRKSQNNTPDIPRQRFPVVVEFRFRKNDSANKICLLSKNWKGEKPMLPTFVGAKMERTYLSCKAFRNSPANITLWKDFLLFYRYVKWWFLPLK